jgi:hypothetical protein
MDRGEAGIAGGGAILAALFKMIEKRDNAFGIEVIEIDLVHVPPTVCREEAQEECDRITVAQNCVGAQPAHTRQVFGEKASEGARQGVGR